MTRRGLTFVGRQRVLAHRLTGCAEQRSELAGCRIALGLLAADCDYMQIRQTLAVLEHMVLHTAGDRAAHRAALDELRLIVHALEMPDD